MKKITFLFVLTFSLFFVQAQEGKQDNAIIDSLKKDYRYAEIVKFLSEKDSLNFSESVLLAEAQFRSGKFYDALKSYDKLYEQDSNYHFLLQKARLYDKIGEERRAGFWYYNVANKAVDNVYYWKLAAKSMEKQADFNAALRCYSIAFDLQNDDLEIIGELSDLLVKMEFYESADSILLSGLAINPEAEFLKNKRLAVLYRQKKYKEMAELAEEVFENLDEERADSKNILIIKKMAGIANYHLEHYYRSISLLEDVIEIESESDILYYYLGLSYRETGDAKKASELLEKSIELAVSDNLPNYYTQLAVSYEESGETVKAIQAYKIAYKQTKDKVLLYHLARNYDNYYEDKKVALSYYEKYLEEKDTANEYLMNYSKHRIQELKSSVHFEGSSF